MSYVNPYLNTYGWGLTVTQIDNNSWQSSTLLTADTQTLTTGQISNIWDPVNRRTLAWSNPNFTSSSGRTRSAVWNIPSPQKAGDIDRVNVLINNTSNYRYIIWNGHQGDIRISEAGQSTGLDLMLGINYLIRIPSSLPQLPSNISSTNVVQTVETTVNNDLNLIQQLINNNLSSSTIEQIVANAEASVKAIDITTSSVEHDIRRLVQRLERDLSNLVFRVQIFPVPDQIIAINTSLSITSSTLQGIGLITIRVHNCYGQGMYLKQRPCAWTSGQNMAYIASNRTVKLQVYRGYQIFLQSSNSTIVSALVDDPGIYRYVHDIYNSRAEQVIYFKTDDTISLESCQGDNNESIFAQTDSSTTNNNNKGWWATWWWVIMIIAIILIILIIVLFAVGRPGQNKEVVINTSSTTV